MQLHSGNENETMEYQGTMAMQAASSQPHQGVYLPTSQQDGLVLLLSCFLFPPTRDYFTDRTGAQAHAVTRRRVVVIVVTIVIDITERGGPTRLCRPRR